VAVLSPLGLKTRIRTTAPIRNANASAVGAGNSKSGVTMPTTVTTMPCQQAWATENPEYWKRYRDENPAYAERNRNLQQQRNQNLRASVIANEDVSRPFNQLPASRYRKVRIEDGSANGDAWIVEIAVLAAIPAAEDV